MSMSLIKRRLVSAFIDFIMLMFSIIYSIIYIGGFGLRSSEAQGKSAAIQVPSHTGAASSVAARPLRVYIQR